MNISHQHTIQSRFALLLLAVFFGSLVVKPAHNLLVHHNLLERVCTNQNKLALTTDHFKDCPVCDFEFCTFIPQQQISAPQIVQLQTNQQSARTVSFHLNVSTHLFLLRAPPAV